MGHCTNGTYAITVPPIQAPGLKEAFGRRSVVQPDIMSAIHGLGRLFGDKTDEASLGIALCRETIITRMKGPNIVPVITVQCAMWTVVDQNLKAHVALLVGSHKDAGVGRVVSPRLYLQFKVRECLLGRKIRANLRFGLSANNHSVLHSPNPQTGVRQLTRLRLPARKRVAIKQRPEPIFAPGRSNLRGRLRSGSCQSAQMWKRQ